MVDTETVEILTSVEGIDDVLTTFSKVESRMVLIKELPAVSLYDGLVVVQSDSGGMVLVSGVIDNALDIRNRLKGS